MLVLPKPENNVEEDTRIPDNDQVNPGINADKYTITKPAASCTNLLLLFGIAGVLSGILIVEIVIFVNRCHLDKELRPERPKYWVYALKPTAAYNKNGYLKHVHSVLERIGYELCTNKTPWSLLWAYRAPFDEINLRNLTNNQKVNHFPGGASITSKVVLSTSNSKYIPKAFRLPKDKNKFLSYAAENKNALFVQKNNTHRNVYLKNISDMDMTSGKTFVQEYIQKPFLVDGHKFDIGVYVVLKSVNPLRVYWYKGDVLFRYCRAKYYPFDPTNLHKYVVGDNYLPTWEVPSLTHPYTALGNTMKEAFDIYVRSMGKDPTNMWEDVLKAIAEVFVMKEQTIINKLKNYSSSENFFEMMRFDFIVGENLEVYLLEANMGPNLNSKIYPPNQLLYEQVLYNLFSLTGVTQASVAAVNEEDATAAKNMVSSQKNIAVFVNECSTNCKANCDALDVCYLCKPCLNAKLKKSLLTAHSEFLHRGDFRRLVPPPMTPNKVIKSLLEKIKDLSPNNKLLHLWYQGKCNQDITWCT